MPGKSTSFVHEPVMVREVAALFASVPAGWVVDCTVGGGGHARVLLEGDSRVQVLGLDQDDDALEAAGRTLAFAGERVRLRKARFDSLRDVVADEAVGPVTGVLFDLGVSSPQLDRPERGFSYRHDASLDMRMDRTATRTAAEVVNTYDEQQLVQILEQYGDERYARRIAAAIVAARPLSTTTQLAEVVRDAIPAPARRRGGHPAKRTFQAIRIEVNDELEVLGRALRQAIDVLAPGGRCAVISYHSGEDRLVKGIFEEASTGGCTCPPVLPCVCGARARVRQLRRGARKPSASEVEANPRSASARLRAAEKLAEVAA
ncbi:16S rRNA (cytosine(1402)-N(4))-methyltransferase RsmH [Rhabdothermincola sediminis]|uniref:16S rRNA (cytosine(1402)-N(4))-methyltransferase RsmH n=1 Tax=Rhabdothermincola sediminis TaxID=2751370 RepID=UPI001AA0152E|nr:16S rRNA (cytosine(1402)-N(4))-methyltransferase RsmH [Rhabdothermincola sediminis]